MKEEAKTSKGNAMEEATTKARPGQGFNLVLVHVVQLYINSYISATWRPVDTLLCFMYLYGRVRVVQH